MMKMIKVFFVLLATSSIVVAQNEKYPYVRTCNLIRATDGTYHFSLVVYEYDLENLEETVNEKEFSFHGETIEDIRANHLEIFEQYVRPNEKKYLSVKITTAWQFFLNDYEVTIDLKKEIIKLIDDFDNNDWKVRQNAQKTLIDVKYFIPLIKMLENDEVKGLSPEQYNKIGCCLVYNNFITNQNTIDVLGRDVNFLIDCLSVADDKLSVLIEERLEMLESEEK